MLFNELKYQNRYYWTFKELIIGSTKEYNLGASKILEFIKIKMADYSSPVISGSGLLITWANSNYPLVLDIVVKRFKDHYCFWYRSHFQKC